MAIDKYEGINDYKLYETLSKNPIQMAQRIIELESRFKKYRIHQDPNRRNALFERLRTARDVAQADPGQGHQDADDILLEFIDDEEVSALYGEIKKWYE